MATAREQSEIRQVAGELESWSIMEIAQFGKYLQDRWGVSAAPVPSRRPAVAVACRGHRLRPRRDRVHRDPEGGRRLQDQRHQDVRELTGIGP